MKAQIRAYLVLFLLLRSLFAAKGSEMNLFYPSSTRIKNSNLTFVGVSPGHRPHSCKITRSTASGNLEFISDCSELICPVNSTLTAIYRLNQKTDEISLVSSISSISSPVTPVKLDYFLKNISYNYLLLLAPDCHKSKNCYASLCEVHQTTYISRTSGIFDLMKKNDVFKYVDSNEQSLDSNLWSFPSQRCMSGYYNAHGFGCSSCPPGHRCPGGPSSYKCTAGTYQPNYGESSCWTCPKDTYSTDSIAGSGDDCAHCPRGFVSSPGSRKPEQCYICSDGQYYNINSYYDSSAETCYDAIGCNVFVPLTYDPSYISSQPWNYVVDPWVYDTNSREWSKTGHIKVEDWVPMYINSSINLCSTATTRSFQDCQALLLGEGNSLSTYMNINDGIAYFVAGIPSFGNRVNTNSDCASQRSTTISPVQPGFYNKDVTKTSHGSQEICPVDHACPGGIGAIPCPIGTYQNNTGQNFCKPCPAGTYGTLVNDLHQCIPCSPGYYQPSEGGAECLSCKTGFCYEVMSTSDRDAPCEAGYYCPDAIANTTQYRCPPGTYCPGNNSIPIPCENGYFCDAAGASAPKTCLQGLYTPSASTPQLPNASNVIIGTPNYVDWSNITEDRAQITLGWTKCKLLLAGSELSSRHTRDGIIYEVEPCYGNTYSNIQTNFQCETCIDSYANDEHTECIPCPSFSKTSSDFINNTLCPCGYYYDAPQCKPAKPGYFVPSPACNMNLTSTKQLPCPSGTYTSEFASTHCFPCPDGNCITEASVSSSDAVSFKPRLLMKAAQLPMSGTHLSSITLRDDDEFHITHDANSTYYRANPTYNLTLEHYFFTKHHIIVHESHKANDIIFIGQQPHKLLRSIEHSHEYKVKSFKYTTQLSADDLYNSFATSSRINQHSIGFGSSTRGTECLSEIFEDVASIESAVYLTEAAYGIGRHITDELSPTTTGSETDSSTDSETDSSTGSSTNSETDSSTGSKTDSETDSSTNSETDSETGSSTDSETGSSTDSETGSSTNSETDSSTGSKTDSETDSSTGSKTGDKSVTKWQKFKTAINLTTKKISHAVMYPGSASALANHEQGPKELVDSVANDSLCVLVHAKNSFSAGFDMMYELGKVENLLAHHAGTFDMDVFLPGKISYDKPVNMILMDRALLSTIPAITILPGITLAISPYIGFTLNNLTLNSNTPDQYVFNITRRTSHSIIAGKSQNNVSSSGTKLSDELAHSYSGISNFSSFNFGLSNIYGVQFTVSVLGGLLVENINIYNQPAISATFDEDNDFICPYTNSLFGHFQKEVSFKLQLTPPQILHFPVGSGYTWSWILADSVTENTCLFNPDIVWRKAHFDDHSLFILQVDTGSTELASETQPETYEGDQCDGSSPRESYFKLNSSDASFLNQYFKATTYNNAYEALQDSQYKQNSYIGFDQGFSTEDAFSISYCSSNYTCDDSAAFAVGYPVHSGDYYSYTPVVYLYKSFNVYTTNITSGAGFGGNSIVNITRAYRLDSSVAEIKQYYVYQAHQAAEHLNAITLCFAQSLQNNSVLLPFLTNNEGEPLDSFSYLNLSSTMHVNVYSKAARGLAEQLACAEYTFYTPEYSDYSIWVYPVVQLSASAGGDIVSLQKTVANVAISEVPYVITFPKGITDYYNSGKHAKNDTVVKMVIEIYKADYTPGTNHSTVFPLYISGADSGQLLTDLNGRQYMYMDLNFTKPLAFHFSNPGIAHVNAMVSLVLSYDTSHKLIINTEMSPIAPPTPTAPVLPTLFSAPANLSSYGTQSILTHETSYVYYSSNSFAPRFVANSENLRFRPDHHNVTNRTAEYIFTISHQKQSTKGEYYSLFSGITPISPKPKVPFISFAKSSTNITKGGYFAPIVNTIDKTNYLLNFYSLENTDNTSIANLGQATEPFDGTYVWMSKPIKVTSSMGYFVESIYPNNIQPGDTVPANVYATFSTPTSGILVSNRVPFIDMYGLTSYSKFLEQGDSFKFYVANSSTVSFYESLLPDNTPFYIAAYNDRVKGDNGTLFRAYKTFNHFTTTSLVCATNLVPCSATLNEARIVANSSIISLTSDLILIKKYISKSEVQGIVNKLYYYTPENTLSNVYYASYDSYEDAFNNIVYPNQLAEYDNLFCPLELMDYTHKTCNLDTLSQLVF